MLHGRDVLPDCCQVRGDGLYVAPHRLQVAVYRFRVPGNGVSGAAVTVVARRVLFLGPQVGVGGLEVAGEVGQITVNSAARCQAGVLLEGTDVVPRGLLSLGGLLLLLLGVLSAGSYEVGLADSLVQGRDRCVVVGRAGQGERARLNAPPRRDGVEGERIALSVPSSVGPYPRNSGT
jgi:hypothetical protein